MYDLIVQIGASAMDNQLLKYTAKDHFFKACICHLCVDLLNAQNALKKYEEMFPAFADSREYKLVKVRCSKEPGVTLPVSFQ